MQTTPALPICPADAVAEDAATPAPLTPAEVALYDFLRATRRELAAERTASLGFRVPLFTVLTNAALREIARLRPCNSAALLRIRGIGPAKLATYGDRVLETLDRHAEALGLNRLEEEAVAAAWVRVAKAPPVAGGQERVARGRGYTTEVATASAA
ncbi:MAG: HRDC domain-containing protein [Myxococcota bacterium]